MPKAIKTGKKATVKGRDIGQNIANIVKKLASGETQDIGDFNSALCEWHNSQRSRLAKLNKDDQIVVLDDQVDTIQALAENANTVGDILRNIERIFSDNTNGGIMFCTVHRSKGLEARNVYILKPELMPHPAAKNEWQRLQEQNLKYVAVTRSLENLYYVK